MHPYPHRAAPSSLDAYAFERGRATFFRDGPARAARVPLRVRPSLRCLAALSLETQ